MIRVGILTALPEVELPAVKIAFNISVNGQPNRTDDGLRYWTTRIKNHADQELEVIVSSLPKSGNTESGLLTDNFLRHFSPEIILFVGIGCGLHSYKLGDVTTAELVWAYEYVKSTPSGSINRSRAHKVPQYITDDLHFFNKLDKWRILLRNAVRKVERGTLMPQTIPENPGLHRGVWIASGEKVMANGELARLNAHHDYIRVGEMEGFGFARACDGHRPPFPWMIIRGISDHGDKSKDAKRKTHSPGKDEYHMFAALAAATFARAFLVEAYTPSSRNNQTSSTHLEMPARRPVNIKTSTLTVGCFDYPPFLVWKKPYHSFPVDGGVNALMASNYFTGPWFWLIQEIVKRLKLKVQFKTFPTTGFTDADVLGCDIIPGVFRTTYREQRFDFSIPVHRIGLQGVCRTEMHQLTKTMILKGNIRIVVQPGEVGWEYVKAEFPRAYACGNVLRISSNRTQEILDMLLCGKYDLAVADEVSCLQFLREVGAEGRFRLAFRDRLDMFAACVAIHKSLHLDLESFDRVVREVRNEATFQRREIKALVGFEHIERCSLV